MFSITDPETQQRRLVRQGDTLRRPLLAQTLRRIAEVGAEDFYSYAHANQSPSIAIQQC
jgi:gamma-glutamyltranspeptidase